MTHEESRKKLTPVQKRFVQEYPLDFNGTEAYLRASNTTNRKSASVQASKLLNTPKVKEAIDIYVQQTLGPKEKHLLENVDFWIEVRDQKDQRGPFVSLQEVKDCVAMTQEEEQAVNSLELHWIPANRTADRLKASENLAKYQQMFVERHDHTHQAQVQIVDDIK
jgi:phage terminase small subunit